MTKYLIVTRKILSVFSVFVLSLAAFQFTLQNGVQAAGETMYFSEISSPVTGSTFQLELRVDPTSTSVSSFRAEFQYATSSVTLTNVDFTGTPFDLPLTNTDTNGTVVIERGTFSTVNSDSLIATLTFESHGVGNSVLAFDNSSVLLRLSDAMDILESTTDYNVTPDASNFNPVYRFYSPGLKRHLFTSDENERNVLINNLSSVWNYEGLKFYARRSASCSPGSAVYRFYSELEKTHLYTIDVNERNILIGLNDPGVWKYENVAYCAYTASGNGWNPVYRFYSELAKTHLYTTDVNERNVLIALNDPGVWKYEGIAYYSTIN